MKKNNQYQPISIETIKQCKGFEHLTDQQAEEILESVLVFSHILFETIQKNPDFGIEIPIFNINLLDDEPEEFKHAV